MKKILTGLMVLSTMLFILNTASACSEECDCGCNDGKQCTCIKDENGICFRPEVINFNPDLNKKQECACSEKCAEDCNCGCHKTDSAEKADKCTKIFECEDHSKCSADCACGCRNEEKCAQKAQCTCTENCTAECKCKCHNAEKCTCGENCAADCACGCHKAEKCSKEIKGCPLEKKSACKKSVKKKKWFMFWKKN